MTDAPGEAAAPSPRLLYIDDDEGLGRLAARQLGRRGFSVTPATSGPAGAALAAAEPFDVIAIDHYMPGQDGLTTMGQILGLPDAPPIVYVTGSDESRIAVAALKAGAADYVVKTGSDDFMDLLASSLQQALEKVRMRRARDAAEAALVAANAQLEEIVARQQVLLREVNHRVANSLQMVSSLVHMQAGAVGEEARQALRDTQARIAAIMQVHRRLYTSDDVQSVSMKDYMDGLAQELTQSLGDSGAGALKMSSEPVELATDKAVSLGVVITELVTNAYKYAYPAGQGGEIRVNLAALGPAGLRLVVEDDGVGLPPGGEVRGTGLGGKVIAAMARSLGSKVAFDAGHKGVRAVLDFQP
ncbi:MAG: response regulator [Caulobacteraceae bacterium]|nr:response regulator [Caulobacter sp.]